jgi:hypothetical protein
MSVGMYCQDTRDHAVMAATRHTIVYLRVRVMPIVSQTTAYEHPAKTSPCCLCARLDGHLLQLAAHLLT